MQTFQASNAPSRLAVPPAAGSAQGLNHGAYIAAIQQLRNRALRSWLRPSQPRRAWFGQRLQKPRGRLLKPSDE